MSDSAPYTGLRVVDLTDVWAGPMAASFLGDLGADVVRVESYPRPGILRPPIATATMPGFVDNEPMKPPSWERSIRYYTSNRNKRGIALNLKDARGTEVLTRLLREADVFIEAYASGVIGKLGFGWDEVRALNPRMIMVSMSGWGHGGPYHGFRSMGSGIDATTGHVHLRGYRDTDVSQTVQAYQSDAAAAATAMFAVGVALRRRKRTGEGSWVDLAQAEVLMAHMPTPYLELAYGSEPVGALENGHPAHAPYGCYPCSAPDSWIQICVQTEAQWRAFCGRVSPALDDDVRFRTPVSRHEHREELDAVVAELTRTWDDEALMETLQGAGVPAGAVYRSAQIERDPQLGARAFLEERDHPIAGRKTYPGIGWRLDGQIQPVRFGSNTLGEHNEEVLGELGFGAAEIQQFYDDGVIGNRL